MFGEGQGGYHHRFGGGMVIGPKSGGMLPGFSCTGRYTTRDPYSLHSARTERMDGPSSSQAIVAASDV